MVTNPLKKMLQYVQLIVDKTNAVTCQVVYLQFYLVISRRKKYRNNYGSVTFVRNWQTES